MGLEGGLRLIDAGADATAAGGSQPKGVVTTALDAANAAEAAGHANELMWLPSLMSTQLQDARPPADEEAQWRALFQRPPIEYLLRSAISCSLGERVGELFLGSHALHFRASAGTFRLTAKGKERQSLSMPYCRIKNFTKTSAKLGGYKGFVLELAPSRAGEKAEPLAFSGFTW